VAEIKRKLYKRGSSFETTLPKPLLFAIDENKENKVVFRFNSEKNRWYIDFEETKKKENAGEKPEVKKEEEKKEVEEPSEGEKEESEE